MMQRGRGNRSRGRSETNSIRDTADSSGTSAGS